MATQEYYVGSVGPLYYDDADTYPDAVPMSAFRGPQVTLDDAPVEDENVMRKIDTETYVTNTFNTYILTTLSDIVSFEDEAVFFEDNIVYNI